jgi:hypothetical protein
VLALFLLSPADESTYIAGTELLVGGAFTAL